MSEYFGYTVPFSGVKIKNLADVVRGGADPQDGQVLQFNAAIKRWEFGSPTGTGNVSNTGTSTLNAIARFSSTDGKSIKNSGVTISDGADVVGAKTLTMSGATSGALTLQPAAATASHALTFPSAQGASASYLRNDGSGVLSWAAGDPSFGGGNVAVLWAPVSGAPAASGIGSGGNAVFSNVAGARYMSLVEAQGDKSILYFVAPASAYWQLRVEMQLDVATSGASDYVKLFGNSTSSAVPLVSTGETAICRMTDADDMQFRWNHNGVDGSADAYTGVGHDHGYREWVLTRSGTSMRFEVSAQYARTGTVARWTLPDAVVSGTIYGVAANNNGTTNWDARVSKFELRLL